MRSSGRADELEFQMDLSFHSTVCGAPCQRTGSVDGVGRTGVERYLLGSVTEKVVRLSDVPC